MKKFIIFSFLLSGCVKFPVDFTTKHNIDVWSEDIEQITLPLMENAIDYYIDELPKIYPLQSSDVRYALYNGRVEWYRTELACEESPKGCAGLQWYRLVLLHWKGYIHKSALFHEFHHVIGQYIWYNSDSEHKNEQFWDTVPILKEKFKILDF